MAYLNEKIETFAKALSSWEEILEDDFSDVVRDATIQRFEYSFELFWKVVKVFLKEKEGVLCSSPKSCFRELRNVLDVSDEDIELFMRMVNDRNLSVHTYNEKLASDLYNSIGEYFFLVKRVFSLIKAR